MTVRSQQGRLAGQASRAHRVRCAMRPASTARVARSRARWKAVTARNIPYVLPVIVIKMLLMPVFGIVLASYLPMDGQYKAAAVLDMAMPSMVLGIVFCDRYLLDSALYAMTVTVTTALSLITLPFWHGVLINEFLK